MAQPPDQSYWAVFSHPTGVADEYIWPAEYNYTRFRGLFTSKENALVALVGLREEEIDYSPGLRENFVKRNPAEEMPHALTPGPIRALFHDKFAFGHQFNTDDGVFSMWMRELRVSTLSQEQVQLRERAEYGDALVAMEEFSFEESEDTIFEGEGEDGGSNSG